MSNKETYRDLHPCLYIFISPWWLETSVLDRNGDIVLVTNRNENTIAIFYFVIRKHFINKSITIPISTQKLDLQL